MKKFRTCLAAAALVCAAAGCAAVAPTGDDRPVAPIAGQGPAQPGPITLGLTATALGETLSSDGWTVYRFEADSHDPPATICENDCLRVWPPLLTDGTQPVLDGIDPALVGTLPRADGTVQMTLGGWPLYRFVDDTASGDTSGENVGGNWSAVAKDGTPLVKK